MSAEEIAKQVGAEPEKVECLLNKLKTLEPEGIFAHGLEECLCIQVEGMEQEEQQGETEQAEV